MIRQRRPLPKAGRKEFGLRVGSGLAVPAPILAWHETVHQPGIYDLEVDTSVLSPVECSDRIAAMFAQGVPRPGAIERLAEGFA